MEKIVIAIDTMGTDNGSAYFVQGIAEAMDLYDDLSFIVTGKEEELKTYIDQYGCDKTRIEVVDATEEITCHDAPVDAIRRKKNSSMVLALNAVKEGRAAACISGGNSGALLAGGQFLVGRAKGVKRTPLAPLIPHRYGSSLLIDCGANVDAKPENLVQFAKMGSIYMKNIEGIENPRVGIINIGAEDEKGNELVKSTIPLLRECKDINFIGSVESRDIPNGPADVLVCEAFVGNVLLKFFEGLGKMFMAEIKDTLKSSVKTKIGGALIYKPIKKTFERYMAYKDAVEHFGLTEGLSTCAMPSGQQNYPASLYETIRRFKTMPDAFVCANDFVAMDLVKALNELGYSVPDDIWVCGFDDSQEASYFAPHLTSIHIHGQIMGYTAANLLMTRIEEPSLNYRTVYTETNLILRESTGD